MNHNIVHTTRQPNPISNSSFLSKLTFWWLLPIFRIGLRRDIDENDIYAVTNSMRSDKNTDIFAKLWQLELKKRRPSILRVMLKVHGFKVISLSILFTIATTCVRVMQPICLGGFVSYFARTSDSDMPISYAYWYATGIVLSSAIYMGIFHPFLLCMFKTAGKMRVACSGLIYQKSLRISKSATKDGQSGAIINLLSTDLVKLNDGLTFLYDVWKGPLEAITFFIVVYAEIGISAAVGFAFLTSFIPLKAWIGRRSAQLRMKKAKRTDFRIKIMNEILMGIQVIKMYAWETSFAKMIDQIRKKEVHAIRSIAYLRTTINSFAMISKLSIFLSLLSYVYFGNAITARKVFMVSSYFNMLNQSMLYIWPVAIMHIAETYVSIKRVERFLLRPESKNQHLSNGNETQNDDEVILFDVKTTCKRIQNVNTPDFGIHLSQATAAWQHNSNHQSNGIFNMNIDIKRELCVIVGPVGAGKSTLLNVILGELELDAGSLLINGSLSYASQEPWIFSGSIRSNILFTEEYDEDRFKTVIKVCGLERDLKLLPHGDATTVGEQGSSLSGGQKARVNLARAIYKQSDIYLLDDPLSAVDVHVGKHIFDKCIKAFLADKICVLVTHQLQYLKEMDRVILMNKGQIEADGAFKSLEKLNKEVFMRTQENGQNGTIQNQIRKNASSVSLHHEKFPNHQKEHQTTGSIKLSTYKFFFKAANNYGFVVIVFVAFIAAQIAWSGCDLYLSEWVNWEEAVMRMNIPSTNTTIAINSTKTLLTESSIKNNVESVAVERRKFLFAYAFIILFGIFCYTSRSLSFYRMCIRISMNLHDMMFRGISRAKMIFFNNNPSGRTLNRFARDIDSVDSLLPTIIVDVLDCHLQFLAVMIINVSVNPWLLIPLAVMILIFFLMRVVFVNSGRTIRRIEGISRSPIFTHINATLQGLSTVRASNAAKILEKEFHELQDHNTSCWYLFICASRWFGLWLDFVCVLFIAIVTYSFLFLENAMDLQSGQVGLSILSSISLITTCQWGLRQSAALESEMTSVERIAEYAKLPSESSLESNEKDAPPEDWPQDGNIEFKSLSLKYSENSHRTLRNLTFRIHAKDKIGVVGRTGAGKSSIIQSLFRLAQNEGQIVIDGVDIGVIGLHDLRKKISIIPQEAVLFSGSLRFNLDPFGEKCDDELWDSLDQVELKTVISAMPKGIDTQVLDGGANFSVGQRQLLCLARAILRNNKILILDEATANVDSDTDKLIQQTIRKRFSECTVITIAHRLNTIMDSDKVLVVDAGEIVEFDHPFELIKKQDGVFKRLIQQTGDEEL